MERRASTLGVFAYGPNLTLSSPAYTRVLQVGTAAKVGRYVILRNDSMKHFYRFFLLGEVNVKPRDRLSPGKLFATASEKTYYDILRQGVAEALYLPSRESPMPSYFINPKLLHEELEVRREPMRLVR